MSPHTPASAHPNGEDLVLRIEGPAAGGSFVARDDGRVVFVSGALPGELVRARTVPGPGKVLRAEVTEVLEASEHRVPDRRIDYLAEAAGPDDRGAGGLFGGMEFAHVDLAHSRDLKAEIVTDQLRRLGDSTGRSPCPPHPGRRRARTGAPVSNSPSTGTASSAWSGPAATTSSPWVAHRSP
ncbi:TRAM domain-containing protein [Brevibacterium casei]|nr:TRAM domain-containing protein [Brevibacterium casei]